MLNKTLYLIPPENYSHTTGDSEPLGFSFTLTDDLIKRYQLVPIKERLRWLEEAQEFMYYAMSKDNWEKMQQFRAGKL